MTRNLKAFGLALVAAMAIGAIGAQAASAVTEHSFSSGAESTVLTGKTESYGNAEHKSIETLTATEGLTVQCYGTYEGQQPGKSEIDKVTVHPKYSTCTPSGTVVHTDGCNFIFESDTDVSSGHFSSEEHATAELECSEGHTAIEITRPGCNIAFHPQTVRGIRYTQLTSHSGKHALTVKATVRTITYTVTSGSFCGLAGHPAGTYHNGKLDGTVEVTGYEAGIRTESETSSTTKGFTWHHGAQTDITINTPK